MIANMHTKWVLLWLVIILLVIGLGFLGSLWFYANFEKEEYQVKIGSSPEAYSNHFLAAEMYLEDQAYAVESRRGMDLLISLPSHEDAIVVRRGPSGMSGVMADNIFAWIEKGGHLLIVPNTSRSEHPGNRNIIEEVGASFQEYETGKDCGCPTNEQEDSSQKDGEVDQDEPNADDEEEAEEADTSSKEEEEYRETEKLMDVVLGGHNIVLQYHYSTLLKDNSEAADFQINGTYRVEYKEKREDDINKEKVIEEKEGAWLLQYKRGAGKITVLSEMDLFTNDSIGSQDHAFFLSWLLGDAEKIWLLPSLQEKSLFAFLWDSFRYFWLSLILAVVLIFWRMQMVSGSRYPYENQEHRNILAHIDATGIFSWRLNLCNDIIQNNRNQLYGRWVSTKLGNRQIGSEEETLKWMAEKSDVREEEIQLAFSNRVTNEQDLIRVSREMMKIHNKIQGGE